MAKTFAGATTEQQAGEVLDEIEAAIAAGRAMGNGAWAILNRVRRLLAAPRECACGHGWEWHQAAGADGCTFITSGTYDHPRAVCQCERRVRG